MRPDIAKVAIIAISGYADSLHKARSIESGCDQHLIKPVDLATLETIIAQQVGNKIGAQR
jgi:YesN/AraC family two-component response regulator